MKLRYYSCRFAVTTAEVRKHREEHQLTLLEAKRQLEQRTPVRLQYFDGNDWVNIEHVEDVLKYPITEKV